VSEDFCQKIITEEEKEVVRKKYHLPEKFILYLGTLQRRKNLPFLVETLALLRQEMPEISLVLAGGTKAHNIDQKINMAIKKNNLEDKVFLPGFIAEEDKKALYATAWIFCWPSLYEGFGIPLLEAMTAGLPVLASKIPPHREITAGSAVLFDPKDKEDLKNNLLRIYQKEDWRQALAQKGKIQAEKFSWAKSAQEFLRLWNAL
jgi:glycosyltransferase involved in cell wall biosynthesis